MTDFIRFSEPEVGVEELEAVKLVMTSGWLTTGPCVSNFETAFSEFLDPSISAISVNSATAGLHLGLEALGIGPGDEVITTTHTFTATAEIIRYLGATPVFVDIDRDSLCIDSHCVEEAITSNTKAIIVVHFGGRSADMDSILGLARRYNLRVMEDAAHALPATYGGKLIGSLDTDVTVFSFYANKTMTTGEGGMVVTRSQELAERMKVMRLHGISRDAFDRFISEKPSWYYEVIAPGYKYNMTDIAASIGIEQLKKVGLFRDRRQEIADYYNRELGSLPIILPPRAPETDIHAWHLYVIQLWDEVALSRDQFIELMYGNGIGCSVHYIPLHLHPYWRDTYELKPQDFPVSQKVFERCVSLPIYSKMTDANVERVVETVKDVLR